MTLEEMKIDSELARVVAARKEQQYIVAQREEDIDRLKKMIDIQLAKEVELNGQLNTIRGK